MDKKSGWFETTFPDLCSNRINFTHMKPLILDPHAPPSPSLSEIEMLSLLLPSIDGKTLNLIRYYEHEIAFLRRHVKGRLRPNEAEKAAFGFLADEIGRADLKDRANRFYPETLLR
jgi:hypothetical protein